MSVIKAARRPWAPRTFPEFAIETGNVLDPWKTFCCPQVFSGVLENSWIVVKLFIIDLLIALKIQESKLNNVIEQVIDAYLLLFSNICLKKCSTHYI